MKLTWSLILDFFHLAVKKQPRNNYGKLSLAVLLPPPYKHRVWDCNEANHNLINETLSNTNWEAMFENSTRDEAVKDFTDIILSTILQFIPEKILT